MFFVGTSNKCDLTVRLKPTFETALVKNQRVSKELDKTKGERDALENEKGKLAASVADLERNNAVFKAHCETLAAENSKFQENNKKLEQQVGIMTGENEKFKENNKKLEQENAKFAENNAKLEQQVG